MLALEQAIGAPRLRLRGSPVAFRLGSPALSFSVPLNDLPVASHAYRHAKPHLHRVVGSTTDGSASSSREWDPCGGRGSMPLASVQATIAGIALTVPGHRRSRRRRGAQ
jgi:hypothetical protein